MELVALIIKKLDRELDNTIIGLGYLLSYWRSNNNTIGKKVTINAPGGIISGIAKDIDESGYLIIQSGKKLSKVISGELILKNDD